MRTMEARVAVLVPCYNEQATIGKVVRDFRRVLPDAVVYVYDNNSKDRTIEIAREAGAVVRTENRQGKGNVVRRMFCDVDADIYIMVDGDDTYDATAAPVMIAELLEHNCAMVVGRRIHEQEHAYRPGHVFGNAMFTNGIKYLFGHGMTDILSGYRVFSRAFVKSFPVSTLGFEIETELTVHTLTLCLPVREIDTRYGARPEGSASKLNTYQDGLRIILKIIELARNERPLFFYAWISFALLLVALILGWPLVVTFHETGLVPRLPTVVGIVGLVLIATISFVLGMLLDSVTRGQRDMKRLAYIQARVPQAQHVLVSK